MKYFIGIDIGTSVCKAVLCDQAGNFICRSERLNIWEDDGVFAEISPQLWWNNTVENIQELIRLSGVEPSLIEAVAISCLGAIMAVDEKGEPLTKGILQMDKRATEQLLELRRLSKEKSLDFHNPITDGLCYLQTMLWLKEKRPELYGRVYKFLTANGYIALKLSGKFTAERSRWSSSLLLDLKNKVWDSAVCAAVGLDIEKLPELVSSSSVIATILPEIAALTGLSPETKVVAGMLDTGAAGLGLASFDQNDAYMVLGTFGKLCIVCGEQGLNDRRFANFSYLQDDDYLVFLSPDSGCGLSLSWFIREFMADAADADPYEILNSRAAEVPPGSNSVFFLPYLAGGRSPLWNLHARALFFGLSKTTSRYEMYRAVLEGFAYAVRHNLELYETANNKHIRFFRVCGGGTRSTTWMQILADVLNRPVQVLDIPDVEAYGAALIAINAVSGSFPPMPKQGKTYMPDERAARIYSRYFPVYLEIHDHSDAIYHMLYEIEHEADQ